MPTTRKGVTLVETLAVISIIVTLGAIGFSLSGPSREKGRQTVCASQLHQIYLGLAQYSSDYDSLGEEYPGLNLSTAPMINPTLLSGYGVSREMLFCPDAPPSLPKNLASTYFWMFAPKSVLGAASAARRMRMLAKLEQETPIVRCSMHDIVFYHPQQADTHNIFRNSFVIDLRLDGSTKGHFTTDPVPGFRPNP